MRWYSISRSVFLLALVATVLFTSNSLAQSTEKVSRFGEYSGYSEERFSEWHETSLYVEMRDGVKLAVDVVRPAVDGQAVDEKFPAVWTHSRYHRNPSELQKIFGGNAKIDSMVDASPDLQRLVKHGYVIVSVGVRGSGASTGQFTGLFSPEETQDAYEITQWLAEQPWCDGNVGMHGASYLGITQYMAASKAPPALKAIFPNVAAFDMYDVIYPGGVYRQDLIQHWDELTTKLDTEWTAPQVATDEDGTMLKKAVRDHARNWEVAENYRASRFRDSSSGGSAYQTHNPAPWLKQINEAAVPAYHWCGWYDVFATDAVIWYRNYEGPQKLAIGSWPHSQTTNPAIMLTRIRLRSAEQHRWFDYWLKGIDNGVMDEPGINLSTLDEPGEWDWSSYNQWPPASATSTTFRFAAGKSNSVDSVNDGLLHLANSAELKTAATDDSFDRYEVDYSTTTGSQSRWDNAVGQGVMVYGDLTDNDRKCLTYTSPPLEYDVTMIGHPVATLFVESEADDADFYVLLEEVDAAGESAYVTEGVLRASHRNLAKADWDNAGLPFQRSFAQDRTPLPKGEVTRLEMDLHPIANVFNKGNRIRIVIMGADSDNTEKPPVPEGTVITIHRSDEYPSAIQLPILKQ